MSVPYESDTLGRELDELNKAEANPDWVRRRAMFLIARILIAILRVLERRDIL